MQEITERVLEWPRLEGTNKLIQFTTSMKYSVRIAQEVYNTFEVEADNRDEAMEKAWVQFGETPNPDDYGDANVDQCNEVSEDAAPTEGEQA